MGDQLPNNNDEDRRRTGYDGDEVIGSNCLRPVFLGNLNIGYHTEDVIALFERPMQPPTNHNAPEIQYTSIPVDRIDHKRGYCFVFLKDVSSQSEKDRAERFVQEINGMNIPNVSNCLRAEFARGDGRVKRKEDERRRNISPSDTLFVVNFHEQTTRRADLEMLFEPFGELLRIDMKRNYAFVQFATVAQATRAKEATNGGKLDQSVLTVEYVAQQQQRSSFRDGRDRGDYRGGGGGDYRDRRDNDYRDRGRDDYRGGGGDRGRGPPPPSMPPQMGGGRGGPPPMNFDRRYDQDRRSPPNDRPHSRSRDRGGGGGRDHNDYDRRGGGGRYSHDDYDRRGGGGRDERGDRDRRDFDRDRGGGGGGGYRERSRSPPRGRYDDRDRYDDYNRDRRNASPPSPPRGYRDPMPPRRGPSPDRGYRP